jgi:hypothetical protein
VDDELDVEALDEEDELEDDDELALDDELEEEALEDPDDDWLVLLEGAPVDAVVVAVVEFVAVVETAVLVVLDDVAPPPPVPFSFWHANAKRVSGTIDTRTRGRDMRAP